MRTWQGVGVGEGATLGPAFVYRPEAAQPADAAGRSAADGAADARGAQGEAARAAFDGARTRTAARLERLRARAAESVGEAEAAIFDAHLMMLQDPMLEEGVAQRLAEDVPLGEAVEAAVAQLADLLAGLEDATLRERAADVRDVGRRLLDEIAGRARDPEAAFAGLRRPSVVLAAELTPSDTVSLPRQNVLAFVTEGGGKTSHVAILARAMGIPAVLGTGAGPMAVADGSPLAVDAEAGLVAAEPDEALRERLAAKMEAQRRAHARRAALRDLPAVARDGFRVELAANLGSADPAEWEAALQAGAEGVGLFRTEFLFLDRDRPPSEEEQAATYARVLERMQDRPVIFRTLDVGGDKPLPFLKVGGEANPFLGQRAIRLMADFPDVFGAQLRALMRAGRGRLASDGRPQLRIMFPMVSGLADVRACRREFDEAWAAVAGEGAGSAPALFGIMVEIPSAAVMMDALAKEVDFASIGTNDLTQYTLAADRTNPRVAAAAHPLDPAVLRLMNGVIQGCREAGVWVGVCGEAGGDPRAIPFFLAAGVNELSMSPGRIPAAKELVRRLDRRTLAGNLAPLLACGTAVETEAFLRGMADGTGT